MDKSVLKLPRRLPVLSLEKMALIRTTTILCNNPELLSLITRVKWFWPGQHYNGLGKVWTDIQLQANRLIARLGISAILQKKIMKMVWPICYKIMLWKFTYAPFLKSQFLRLFYWTYRGRIDSVKTMKSIVNDTRISIRKRFILACGMSLIPEMHEMWKKMSDVDKKYFCRPNKQRISPLLLVWARTFEESDNEFDHMSNALLCCIENGLFEGIKGLFEKFSASTRKEMAVFCIKEYHKSTVYKYYLQEDETDIVFFIFSEMTEENQIIFSSKSELVLMLFVDAPEHYFLNFLELMLQAELEFYLGAPLLTIFHYYHLEFHQDYDYGSLFIEFWRKLPISMKLVLREIGLGEHILASLIVDNFRWLLDINVPLENIPELVLISDGNMVFRKSNVCQSPNGFHKGKWLFLHFIVSEEIATVDGLMENKELLLDGIDGRIYSEEKCFERILEFVRRIETILGRNKT